MCRNATDFLCIDFVSCNFPEFVNSNSFLMESLGFSIYNMGLSCGSEGREIACHAGDLDSIPGSGKSPGEGNGYPLQYTCLENPWTEKPGRLSPWDLLSFANSALLLFHF